MGAFRLHPSGPPSSSRPRHQHIAQIAATFYYCFYPHLDHNQKVGYHKQTPDLQRIGTTSNHGRNTRGFSASPAPSTAGHPISSLPKAARRASTQDLEVCAAAGAHHYAAALHRLCQREGIPESKREGCVVVSVAVGRTPCHHEAPNLACYESRKIWRKKYHDPRGHKVAAKLRRAGIPTPALDKFHFTMPYICYETDIFTVSKAWNIGHTSDRDQEETFLDWWDPFLGLDRARIQHAGLRLWDNIEPFSDTVTSLDIKRLDALRTLSLFMLGPDPGLEPGITSARPGWVQMSPLVLQRDFYFELRDISPSQLEHHPMFRDRIISRRSTTGRLDRPLRVLVPWTKAWLWHYVHCGKAMHKDVFLQDLGPDYMMDPLGWAGRPCPLGLSGCQTGDYAHSQKNIWDWIPENWKIKTRFLCEKEWLQDLERVGLFRRQQNCSPETSPPSTASSRR
ncbi:predicted protein [Chaetomium globosum CBS 148.51]|uniref:Uncharacterized protein n=1 Tax=Chaetomium globosum (strain ATCC 6205 / CBS 148.51 / DSM 1962 / NBRC 6347 / NRRL 1970) TaxID=306901 RepID=Q2GZ85_CHAGB|nr:uncharacterized protein CHGG_05161 [Chaetomium globosum CBS 148.51]EAQ88542.1 predicted protein [Chaetomium globosum CBS 148.51]